MQTLSLNDHESSELGALQGRSNLSGVDSNTLLPSLVESIYVHQSYMILFRNLRPASQCYSLKKIIDGNEFLLSYQVIIHFRLPWLWLTKNPAVLAYVTDVWRFIDCFVRLCEVVLSMIYGVKGYQLAWLSFWYFNTEFCKLIRPQIFIEGRQFNCAWISQACERFWCCVLFQG